MSRDEGGPAGGGHLDDAGAGVLPAHAGAAPAQGQQHGMGRHRRVSYERRFLVGIEKAQPYIVIRAGRREHEGDFGMRELPRHILQDGVAFGRPRRAPPLPGCRGIVCR